MLHLGMMKYNKKLYILEQKEVLMLFKKILDKNLYFHNI
jgi:hypothetical protein